MVDGGWWAHIQLLCWAFWNELRSSWLRGSLTDESVDLNLWICGSVDLPLDNQIAPGVQSVAGSVSQNRNSLERFLQGMD